MTRARSGRERDDITLDALRERALGNDDVRIHPETLEHQAQVAEGAGNPQLAANFRRAAELTDLPDSEVLAIYEALRPGRSSAADLLTIADSLEQRGATMNAVLLREAATVYERRGLLQ
ncbi:MAG: diol dehydratase small subunit [Actinobacteria bacterium]|nr:diol dehydratase small subunit [Actinomycetota bacterium]